MKGNEIEKSVTEIKFGNGDFSELIDLSTSSRGHNIVSFRPKRSGVEKSIIEIKFGNGKYGESIDLSTSSRGQAMTPSVTSGHLPHGGRLELSLRDGYGVNEKINSTFIPLNEGESEERAGGAVARRPVSFETGLGRKSTHGPLNTSYGKLAFTLVELIVVIVILGVLATVGFLAFANYPKQARDTVRISHLKEIEDALEFYKIEHGDYPIPTGGETNTGEIEGFTGITWYKGKFGADIGNQISAVTKTPTDPKTGDIYDYFITENLQSYRITANLEIKNKDTGEKNYTVNNKLRKLDSCLGILENGKSTGDGLYTIYPDGNTIQVYCDMTTSGGGWTLMSNTIAKETTAVNGGITNDKTASNGKYQISYASWGAKEILLECKLPSTNDTKKIIITNMSECIVKNFSNPKQYQICNVGENGVTNYRIVNWNIDYSLPPHSRGGKPNAFGVFKGVSPVGTFFDNPNFHMGFGHFGYWGDTNRCHGEATTLGHKIWVR